jgi:hypothetical protein
VPAPAIRLRCSLVNFAIWWTYHFRSLGEFKSGRFNRIEEILPVNCDCGAHSTVPPRRDAALITLYLRNGNLAACQNCMRLASADAAPVPAMIRANSRRADHRMFTTSCTSQTTTSTTNASPSQRARPSRR